MEVGVRVVSGSRSKSFGCFDLQQFAEHFGFEILNYAAEIAPFRSDQMDNGPLMVHCIGAICRQECANI